MRLPHQQQNLIAWEGRHLRTLIPLPPGARGEAERLLRGKEEPDSEKLTASRVALTRSLQNGTGDRYLGRRGIVSAQTIFEEHIRFSPSLPALRLGIDPDVLACQVTTLRYFGGAALELDGVNRLIAPKFEGHVEIPNPVLNARKQVLEYLRGMSRLPNTLTQRVQGLSGADRKLAEFNPALRTLSTILDQKVRETENLRPQLAKDELEEMNRYRLLLHIAYLDGRTVTEGIEGLPRDVAGGIRTIHERFQKKNKEFEAKQTEYRDALSNALDEVQSLRHALANANFGESALLNLMGSRQPGPENPFAGTSPQRNPDLAGSYEGRNLRLFSVGLSPADLRQAQTQADLAMLPSPGEILQGMPVFNPEYAETQCTAVLVSRHSIPRMQWDIYTVYLADPSKPIRRQAGRQSEGQNVLMQTVVFDRRTRKQILGVPRMQWIDDPALPVSMFVNQANEDHVQAEQLAKKQAIEKGRKEAEAIRRDNAFYFRVAEAMDKQGQPVAWRDGIRLLYTADNRLVAIRTRAGEGGQPVTEYRVLMDGNSLEEERSRPPEGRPGDYADIMEADRLHRRDSGGVVVGPTEARNKAAQEIERMLGGDGWRAAPPGFEMNVGGGRVELNLDQYLAERQADRLSILDRGWGTQYGRTLNLIVEQVPIDQQRRFATELREIINGFVTRTAGGLVPTDARNIVKAAISPAKRAVHESITITDAQKASAHAVITSLEDSLR